MRWDEIWPGPTGKRRLLSNSFMDITREHVEEV
jgi:hypothetical protein